MGRKSGKNNALLEPLDMLILKILSRENLHGYAIVQAIHRSSGDEILTVANYKSALNSGAF
jgi:DNA-binding PadR family transcriptional regulator